MKKGAKTVRRMERQSSRIARQEEINRILGAPPERTTTKTLHKVGIVIAGPHDPVNAPQHYRAGDVYETIRVIEAWQLNFRLGNCVKYISRAGQKGDKREDLEKARWYLDREIAHTPPKSGQ